MKLVVIQGNVMVRYVDGEQESAVSVPYWEFDGVHETVEEFRVNGVPHG